MNGFHLTNNDIAANTKLIYRYIQKWGMDESVLQKGQYHRSRAVIVGITGAAADKYIPDRLLIRICPLKHCL